MAQADSTRVERDDEDGGATPTAVPDTLRIDGDEVRFRDFRRGDEAQIVDVYRAAFGSFFPEGKPVDPAAYITWFTEPHASHQARVVVAEVGGTIVSAHAGLRRSIKMGSVELYGVAGGVGGATHPDYQGMGISRATRKWLRSTDDPPRTAGVATRLAELAHQRPNPVPFRGRMGVYSRVLAPRRLAAEKSAWPKLPAYLGLAAFGWLRPLFRRRTSALSIRTAQSFDQRHDKFLEHASGGWDVIPLRSVEYLNWRFSDPRAGRFVVRVVEEGDEPVGYIVLHAVGAGGHIVDLLALQDRLDVVRALVDDAIGQFRQLGASSVECWMLREQPYARVLRHAGFVALPRRSAQIAGEVGWSGGGMGAREHSLLNSPQANVHLVRADFDAI